MLESIKDAKSYFNIKAQDVLASR